MDDDELLARLRQADKTIRHLDTSLAALPEGQPRWTSAEDRLRLGIEWPINRSVTCDAQARIRVVLARGGLTADLDRQNWNVTASDRVTCDRPKGHDGLHVSCPPPTTWHDKREERRHHGSMGHRWEALPPVEPR